MSDKWVYNFSEVDQAEKAAGNWEGVRALLGGKGANLAEMTRIEIPVPPGFTVTTEACNTYLAAGETLPETMWEQVLEGMRQTEKATGKTFGTGPDPLLVSCRSGAKFSMPGMMDTVLNIGLNDETVEALIKLSGDERLVYDLYRRLFQMFGSVVLGIPDEAFEDLIEQRKAGTAILLISEDLDEILALSDRIAVIYEGQIMDIVPREQATPEKLGLLMAGVKEAAT